MGDGCGRRWGRRTNGLRLSKGNSPPPCAAGRAIWIPETAPRSGPPRGPSAAREPAISGCDAASADDCSRDPEVGQVGCCRATLGGGKFGRICRVGGGTVCSSIATPSPASATPLDRDRPAWGCDRRASRLGQPRRALSGIGVHAAADEDRDRGRGLRGARRRLLCRRDRVLAPAAARGPRFRVPRHIAVAALLTLALAAAGTLLVEGRAVPEDRSWWRAAGRFEGRSACC